MIINNVNPTKLLGEFFEAKINITFNKIHLNYINEVATSDIGDLEIIFEDDTDMELVQTIIDAHDPTPIPQPLSETEKIRLEMARSNSEMFETMLSLFGGM